MASLACQRPSVASIGSELARIRHEPFDAGSNARATILKQQECPSPRLWSCYAVNDRNGVLLGNVSGTAGVEGRRFPSSAHEGGASMCVFQETAQPLQRSDGPVRNHLMASVAQQPEAINTTQAVGGEATALDDPQAMDDDNASTTSLSLSSTSDEEEVSSCTSSEDLAEGRPSPQHGEGPLDSLSALCKALPVKRGLSRYFAGKSQSFACLADVRSVADLAKPLNPFVKRRKTGNCIGKEACHRPRSLDPASSISKRPVNSHRKGYHVATLPRSIPRETIYTIATDYQPNSIALKCFSSPELGEAAI